jgi:hypothetical protein
VFKKFLAATFIPLALSGCATPYGGATEAQMITNDTARISARGNAYTDKSRIMDFVLLKAAQATLARGFTHFTIVNESDDTKTGIAGYAGSVETYVKPGQDLIVRFCKEEGKEKCPGLPANEIVQNLGPRYLAQR